VTLREALRSLQESGYVESRPGRSGGTFVLRRPSAKDVDTRLPQPTASAAQDVLDLRRILERGACEYAANAVLSATERALLQTTLEDCSAASPEEYRALDSRLHLTIAEMCHVPSLAALVADARERLNDLLDSFPLLPPNIANSNRQHVRIVKAILRGDAEAAVAEMERHMRGTASLITAFLT
jgi:DNA-binding FadR family transcriptional regulator